MKGGAAVSRFAMSRLVRTEFLSLIAALLSAGVSSAGTLAREVEYYHQDALGSVRAVTDGNGAPIAAENRDYLPYGEQLCGTTPCSGLPAGQPRRFTGKERDTETGLDYFGARYYGASFARFTTVDPVYTWRDNLVDPQRWNRYAYGRDNPYRYVDPDGRAVKPKGKAADEAKKYALKLARGRGVARAWAAEHRILREQGAEVAKTRFDPPLTAKEIKQLRDEGQITGWIGHHINNVAANDIAMAENPNNIKFVKGLKAHMDEHPQGTRAPTKGPFIDRMGEFLIGLLPGMGWMDAGEAAVEVGGAGADEFRGWFEDYVGDNLRAKREALAAAGGGPNQ
jgi:RHS repeat-associated protein